MAQVMKPRWTTSPIEDLGGNAELLPVGVQCHGAITIVRSWTPVVPQDWTVGMHGQAMPPPQFHETAQLSGDRSG